MNKVKSEIWLTSVIIEEFLVQIAINNKCEKKAILQVKVISTMKQEQR